MQGTVIGEYEVLERLGAGAAGEVYRARHQANGDLVALKLLHLQTAADPDIQKRFVREVSVLERLDHPHIVRHRDCGIHDGALYFAMEMVNSGTLRDVLTARGALPWREAAEVASQICEAFEYAHAAGVVHRDLKPDNLFLSAEEGVKVGDFGLARDAQNTRLTLQGQTVGTCRYMAPEQVRGEDHLTGGVDLYALGCLLAEMVSGRPLFDGATVIEVFERHLHTEPPRLAVLVPSCPEALSELVARLLEKSVEERPVSAAEVREDLSKILQGESVAKRSPSKRESPLEAPQATAPLTERLLSGERNERGLNPHVLWVVLGLGGILAILAMLLGRGS